MSVHIDITYACRIESTANRRWGWAQLYRHNNGLRAGAYARLFKEYGGHLWGRDFERVTVTFTRIAPRKLDDDNNVSAFKGVRDGVAEWAKLDDGNDRWTWRYEQQRGEPKEYAVRIEVVAE